MINLNDETDTDREQAQGRRKVPADTRSHSLRSLGVDSEGRARWTQYAQSRNRSGHRGGPLYAHIQDLDELLSLVLDSTFSGVRIPRAREQWDKALEQIVLSYLRVLFRHAGVARLAITTIATGPNSLRIMEAILQLLEKAGCSGAEAAWGADLILQYAASTAAEQSARKDDLLREIAAALEQIDAAKYPRVHALRRDFFSDGINRFLWGLRAIVKGILGESGIVRKGPT